jgi:hypothetical protein
MDENRWKGFNQSSVKIRRYVGGYFSLFNSLVEIERIFLESRQLNLLERPCALFKKGKINHMILSEDKEVK